MNSILASFLGTLLALVVIALVFHFADQIEMWLRNRNTRR